MSGGRLGGGRGAAEGAEWRIVRQHLAITITILGWHALRMASSPGARACDRQPHEEHEMQVRGEFSTIMPDVTIGDGRRVGNFVMIRSNGRQRPPPLDDDDGKCGCGEEIRKLP